MVAEQGVLQRRLNGVLKKVLVFCDDCPDRVACDTVVNRCAVVKMVAESTRRQGLPLKVTDPEVRAGLAVLFTPPVFPAPTKRRWR